MKFGAIVLLAVGLAMDATAVAAARGLVTPRIRARHMLLVGGLFGGFQALMPLLGWLLGANIGPWIKAWDHWVVFLLLGALGLRMLQEARARTGAAPALAEADAYGLRVMLALALATSIDALAQRIARSSSETKPSGRTSPEATSDCMTDSSDEVSQPFMPTRTSGRRARNSAGMSA